jgi:hypothetical protein
LKDIMPWMTQALAQDDDARFVIQTGKAAKPPKERAE